MLKEWDALTKEKWENYFSVLFKSYSKSLDIWEYDDRGTINAVYQFLHGLGCRWYFPGELGEVVPRLESIPLPQVDKTYHPDFAVRNLYQYYQKFFMGAEHEIMWQLRLGLNSGYKKLGIGPLGHGINAVHGRNENKKTHPEYYAVWGGKRMNEEKGAGKPCLSSERLFEQNVKYLRTMFDIYDEPLVNISPADGYMYLCECEWCKGKSTPERGLNGTLSDYVWEYVNRVAKELYKTHPDRKVSCLAYTSYQQPPAKIKMMSPNVSVILCQWRSDFHEPEMHKKFLNLREDWLKKLPSKELYIWDYYLHARPDGNWQGIPVYFPHIIAEDLKSLKGKSQGEFIEIQRNWAEWGIKWHALAANHLNLYVTSRFYWDAEQDIDALLEEYYQLFYGPAAGDMKDFVEFAEANWMKANNDVKIIDRLFQLMGNARKAAGEGIYGKRLDLMVEYVDPLRQRRDQLARGRKGVPKARAYNREKKDIKVDGILDDVFWQNMNAYSLSEVETGLKPVNHTSFKIGWDGESLYFGVTCYDQDTKNLKITATKDGDAAIWLGDNVELLLETQSHSYYQITINPAGAMIDLDRKQGINDLWSAGAEVASYIGDGYWNIEIRIPVAGDGQELLDPFNGVSGRKPTNAYPWFFNICRQRIRDNGMERSAFSPTGKNNFHEVLKFGELYSQ